MLRLRRRDHEAGDATVGMADDRHVAVGPRLLRDPVVDDELAVQGGAPAEQVELSAGAPGAARRRVHRYVVVLPPAGHLAAVLLGQTRDAVVLGEGATLCRRAVVPRHLEDGRIRL